MKCSTCGTNLEPGDAFCPECGTKAAPAQAAAKPAAPPPPQYPKQTPATAAPPRKSPAPSPAAEDEEILPGKKKKEKKQKPPKEPKKPKAPREPKAPKDPNAKKKPVALLIVLLVVAAGAAAYMTFGNKSAEPPMPVPNRPVRPAAQRPTPAARTPRTGDIQEPGVDKFAARVCRNSMSDVKAVDDLTSFEFIARISADPAALASKKIDMRDYVSAAADAVRADIEKQGMKPCESCRVALAKEMECGQTLGALGSVLAKENLLKNTSEIRPAAAEIGVANCGVFVLEQKWPGAAQPSQVAYFTGEINGRRTILFYAATNHFASEIAPQ
jgi:outer membrane biosynthesis protein TonB